MQHLARLLASEGAIISGIYQDRFSRYGFSIQCADDSDHVRLREFIEAVKQDKIADDVKHDFSDYIDRLAALRWFLVVQNCPCLFLIQRLTVC